MPKVVEPNGSKAKSEKTRSSPFALARQCWPVGEVREFGEVLRSLEAGETPKGSITVAPSVDKALELKQLTAAHGLDLTFACVVGMSDKQLPPKLSWSPSLSLLPPLRLVSGRFGFSLLLFSLG